MVLDFHHVGIADLRSGVRCFLVYDYSGKLILRTDIETCDEFRPFEHEALRQLALDLVNDCRTTLSLLVFITSADGQPPLSTECITVFPFPVFRITDVKAAAHAVPDDWHKFQLIDFHSRTWWLLEQCAGELRASSQAALTDLPGAPIETASRFTAFGFKNIASIGEPTDGEHDWPEATPLSAVEWYRASKRAVESASLQGGCQLSRNGAGHQIFRLTATRTVSYPVVQVAQPIFSLGESALASMTNERPVLFIVDQTVDRLYGERLDNYAYSRLNCAGKIALEASEAKKTGATVARLCRAAAKLGFPRHGLFAAVGGGVTLDIVGLAASLYYRGIGYLRIPTTLVGLIDAGLGIKQGVNFAGKKNLVGAFYPPIGVINDLAFLRTLPLSEISCGLAEMVKIAIVRDHTLFEAIERNGEQFLKSRFSAPPDDARITLLRSSQLMLEELQPNLYESDLRRLADFGHSFSPAIETLSGYAIPHGFAVAMDMHLSTAIAALRGLCSRDTLARLGGLLKLLRLPAGLPPASVDQLCAALESTRQRRGGDLNLVVPTAIGRAVFLQEVSRNEIAEALALLADMTVGSTSLAYAGTGD